MALQQYQITTFESCAIQMCYRLNESPYEPIDANGTPRWTLYAEQMARHLIMLQCLRDSGHPA